MDEKKKLANYDGVSLVTGGLIYNLITFIFKTKDPVKNRRQRAFLFALIAWLPLCILILFSGDGLAVSDELGYLKNFEIHIRFLFAVPFLIFIEKIVDNSFIGYIKTSYGLTDNKEQSQFNLLIKKIDKLSNMYFPEVLILIIIYTMIFIRWNDPSLFDASEDYLYDEDGTFSAAGMYLLFVSMPIFQLLLFRWIWRWVIWMYSLIKISKFTFYIDAMNIDQKAGLTYLNLVPSMFSVIFFALAAVLSAKIGFEIINTDITLKSFYLDILFFVIGVPLILYSPLFIFISLLHKTKSKAIHEMGALVAKHNQDYMKKWVESKQVPKEPILGSVDNSSLSDINGGYAPAINMNFIPVDSRMFMMSCAVLLVPFVPLIFTYYSLFDLVRMVLNSVFG